MADSACFIELASNAGDYFTTSVLDDIMIHPLYATQKILLGTSNGQAPSLTVASNNVGIGTTSPTAPLQITATSGQPNVNGLYVYNPAVTTTANAIVAARTTGAGGNPYISLDIASNAGWSIGISNADSDKLVIKSAWDFSSNPRVTVDTVGNVGIGTTTPGYMLHVSSNTTTNGTIVCVDNPNTGTGGWSAFAAKNSASAVSGGMRMGITGTGFPNYGMYPQNGGFIECDQSNGISIGATSNSGSLRFHAGGTTEVMRVNSNANVGVGTTAPAYKLDVSGDINLSGNLYQNGVMYTSASSQWSNNSSNVFLLSSNVGIGTSAPSTTLDVNGTINATTYSGSTITSLSNLGMFGSNTSVWSSNNLLSKTGGTATGTVILTSQTNSITNSAAATTYPLVLYNSSVTAGTPSSGISFVTTNNAPGSTSPGAAILFERIGANSVGKLHFATKDTNCDIRMTINSAGLVGISNQNPAYNLDVAGTINATTYVGGTITSLSNLGIFGSNTAISASNTTISLSNYVYGTNTTNITNAQTTADWASNAGLFGSNTSVWSSNNLLNKTGGTTTGTIVFTSQTNSIAPSALASAYPLCVYNPTVSQGAPSSGISFTTTTFASGTYPPGAAILFERTGGSTIGRLHFATKDATNCETRMTINSNGYVGISNQNPAYNLDVSGVGAFGSSATYGQRIAITDYEIKMFGQGAKNYSMFNSNSVWSIADTSTNAALGTAGTQLMCLSNAQLGVGTSSPAYKLDVAGSARLYNAVISDMGYGGGWAGIAHANMTSGGNYALLQASTGQTVINAASGQSVNVRIANVDQGAWNGTGLGIGTTSPSYKLDVNGTTMVRDALEIAANSNAWDSTTAGRQLYMRYSTNPGQDAAYIQSIDRSNATYYNLGIEASNIGIGGSGSLVAPRLYVRNDGNVGVGTVAPSYKLDVAGNVRADNQLAITDVSVLRFQIGCASGPGQYSLSAASNDVVIRALQNPSRLLLQTGSNVSAALCVNSNNYVGIGNVAPQSPLDVQGDVRASGTMYGTTYQSTSVTIGTQAGSYTFPQVMAFTYSNTAFNNNGSAYITAGSTRLKAQTLVWSGTTVHGAEIFLEGGKSPLAAQVPGSVVMLTSNVERVRVDENGSVGIGTPSPSYKLDVSGVGAFGANANTRTLVTDQEVKLIGNGARHYSIFNSNSQLSFRDTSVNSALGTAGTTLMTLDGSTTNVGIGTSNPSYKLDVSGTTHIGALTPYFGASTYRSMVLTPPVGQTIAELSFEPYAQQANSNVYRGYVNATTAGVSLGTASNNINQSALTMTYSGLCGIGTGTPQYQLDVVGAMGITNGTTQIKLNTNTVNSLQILNSSTTVGPNSAMYLGNTNATGNCATFIYNYQGSGASGNYIGIGCYNSDSTIAVTHGANVGIGTTTPAYKLDVVSSSATAVIKVGDGNGQYGRLMLGNTNHGLARGANIAGAADANDVSLYTSGSGAVTIATAGVEALRVTNGGNVAIGLTTASYKLHVNGTIYATGDIIGFSDKRLKSNITIIDGALQKLHKLNGYTFNIKDDDRLHTGLIAQEVRDVLPEAVYQQENPDGTDGYYSIAYGNMAGILVEAIKEVDTKYSSKISELQEQLINLQNELITLKASMQTR